jgi:nitrite reductase (cytochrome c-552)
VLKAQHPEFEMWNQGIHARSGVACADCHMPYKREGALKISDHHVRSPLLNINHACQTCHKWPEAELRARVEAIQERTHRYAQPGHGCAGRAHWRIEAARAANAPTNRMAAAQEFQRKAQFYLDLSKRENSSGFHAPRRPCAFWRVH